MSLVLFLSGAASAIIPFTPENTVSVSSVSVQAVLPISGGYRMYVSSNGFAILSATSTNQTTWSLESGIRLSTGASGVDSSSITSCGIGPSTNPAGLRMYYVGVSNTGAYSILSATSTDGLTWGKESGIRLQQNNGTAFLDSPRPIAINSNLIRLFYVADTSGGNTPANYRVFSATSTDGGITFVKEGPVFASDVAYQVSVTTLTDGRTRLYYSAPLTGQTTASQVLSAISSNGLTFAKETGVRLSTSSASAALIYPVVVRSTESFRWRMFSSYIQSGTTAPFVSSALTLTPVPISLNPSSVLKNQSGISFTVTGEIFSPSPSVTFTIGSDTITATSVAQVNDLTITGTMTPLNKSIGHWDLVVTNADSRSGTLARALFIDVPSGTLTITDNLFRPLKGGAATISITTFDAGQLTVKLYTSEGGLVNTLFDAPTPAQTTVLTWNGKTSLGNTVASGVYLLKTIGPKLNRVDKIVVIK